MISIQMNESGRGKDLSHPIDFRSAFNQALGSGFADLDGLSSSRLDLKSRASQVRERFDCTLILGIGGSYWTPKSFHSYFGASSSHKIYFIDSPNPRSFRSTLDKIEDFKKCHFLFVSKSGGTLETLSLLSALLSLESEFGIQVAQQATVVCSRGENFLQVWAREKKVPVLEIPMEVGGRYSAFSPVGVFPLELLGLSSENFFKGAFAAQKKRDEIESLVTFNLRSFDSQKWITQMWSYSESLLPVAQWWQQIWSESLAKKDGSRVSSPMVCCGPRDQHSNFQQLLEGEYDKSVYVLQDLSADFDDPVLGEVLSAHLDMPLKSFKLSDVLLAELEGFCGALSEKEIPYVRLGGDFSDLEVWGEFFMMWQMTVATMGHCLKMNPYDQPGVELGKTLARQYLKSMK
ncbi:hypothetical protein GW916_05845 [bacterium]|nr:hypothetical protein [bacterium]